jgi:ABC-type sugar transport system ATPase subunit
VQQVAAPEVIYDAPANLAVGAAFGAPPMNLIQGALKQDRDAIRFVESGEGSIELSLSGAPESVRELTGQQIVLGLRAEDIAVAQTPKGQGNSGATFPAVAELVERVGAQTMLYLQTGAHAIVCRSSTVIPRVEAGRRMRFDVDPARLHFFNPSTGERLGSP